MSLSDNTTSALIAAAMAAITGLSGWAAGRILKREGVTDRNLGLQLQGWKDFADILNKQLRELNDRLDECEQDRNKLWLRVRELERKG